MSSIRHLIEAALSPRTSPGDLFARVEAAAHDAATSPYSRDQPTAEQIEANRYRTGRVDIQGLPIRIENPRGTRREKPGKWSNLMTCHYGDIAGTRGADGDPVDVFIGPFPELATVWVVNQRSADGGFDEHKVCIGFTGEQHARDAYLSAYRPGWKGLESIVRATVTQLKWWLKFGDTSRPFTPEVLPYEGTPTMDKVLWNSQAEPVTQQLPAIMYALRVEDAEAGLMLDAADMAEMMTDPDVQALPVYDAMVVEVGRLQPKMEALRRIMEAASDAVKPTEMSIGDPVRYRGVAQVMVLFTMSDGQTVSVWLHNPDTTPAKLMPLDELISWKWMLNKKDVTIVVAPEKGRDLNPREVARRIMRLVERNSAAFTKANARTAEKAEQLKALDTEIGALEAELADLQGRIEVAKVEAETKPVATGPHYSDLTLQALIDNHGWKAAYFTRGGDSGQMISVSREFVGVGPLGGMISADGMRRLFAGYNKDQDARRYIALTLGDTVIGDWDGREFDPVGVARTVNKEAEKFADEARAKNGLPPMYSAGAQAVTPSFDDYLAAVVFSLSEKGGMSAADAAKLAKDSNLVSDGHADDTPAEQVADQILAANTRSQNVERAYAIAEHLIAQYGWAKSLDNDMPEMGINLESPRDNERWVYLGEEQGRLVADHPNTLSFRFDTDLSSDSVLAQNIDLADFEAELDTGVDGLLGDGEEFAGKTVAFAYAAEVLRKGAANAGAKVQFGDFNGSASGGLFDKLAPSLVIPAEVSVYGITAQIQAALLSGVLARASIDEAGNIEILKGGSGTDVAGTPRDAADVLEILRALLIEKAAKPAPVVEPEPAKPGETTAVMGVSEGEDIPDAEDPIAKVNAAYAFDDATDEFKRWVADSVDDADYSTFLSAKNIDIAAKKHGASVAWAVAMVTDSVEGGGDGDGAILDNAGAKKIVVDDQVPVKDRPFGAKQVAFVSWGASGGAFLVDIDKDDRLKFGGGTFMAPAGELPGGARLVRLDPKAMTMQVAQKGGDAIEWTEPVKLKGIKVQNLGKFTGAFRVAAVMDSVDDGDMVLDAAEGWETVVGTIKKGSKIVGRAHVGGDGKSMVYVGKTGNTRVQFLSKFDGQLRDGMWSENPEYMVEALFTEPVNGVATEAAKPAEETAPAENDLTRLAALRKLAPKDREAVTSDDPQIIEKLTAKANYLAANGEMMRKANKLVRKGDRDGLIAMGFTGRVLEGLFEKDFAGRIGFADYELSNNTGVLRTTRLRLEELMKNQKAATPAPADQEPAGIDWMKAEQIDQSMEALAAFGTVTINDTGSENVYFVKDGKPYFTKLLDPDNYEAGQVVDFGALLQPVAESNPDRDFLQSMVDGTVNLLDPAIAERLVPMVEQYAEDADMTALIERAAQAYGDAAVAAAREALAAA